MTTRRRRPQDVERCAAQLGIDTGEDGRIIEVWNKIDRLDAGRARPLANIAERSRRSDRPVLVSA